MTLEIDNPKECKADRHYETGLLLQKMITNNTWPLATIYLYQLMHFSQD
jgi:hypothetical protein